MFLLKDILLSTYFWFINIELMANSTITHALKQLLYKACLRHSLNFLHKAHHSLSELRNTRQPFSPILLGHFKQQNQALQRWHKDFWLSSPRTNTRRQRSPCQSSVGTARHTGRAPTLCCSGYLRRSENLTWNHPKYWLKLQINFTKEVNSQIWEPAKITNLFISCGVVAK